MTKLERLVALSTLVISCGAVATWAINMNVAVAQNSAGILRNSEEIAQHYHIVEDISRKLDRVYDGLLSKGIIDPE